MAETIESFVAKLQAEGVEAGEEAAEKIRQEARNQAEQIVADAGSQADKIVADAKRQADDSLARSRTELELAARDAALRLRKALGRALDAVLSHAAEEQLKNTDFLGKVLHELVMLYAKADLEGDPTLSINVSPQIQEELAKWALGELAKSGDSKHLSIDLKTSLSQAGFEYNISGATVEVTLDSVVAALSELVGSTLRDVLDKAVAEQRS